MLRRLREEDGIALILALLVMAAVAVGLTTVIEMTSASGRTSSRASASQSAYSLAEAGMSNAMAVLHGRDADGTVVNALDPTALPDEANPRTDTYSNGSVVWYGAFDGDRQQWTLTSTGHVRNPNGVTLPDVTRTLTAKVQVTFDLSQDLNAQAWNYLYSTHTGSTCDMSLVNTVTLQASLFVEGNLCLQNSAKIMPATAPPSPAPAVNLVVKGAVSLSNGQNTIGTSTQKINSATIGGGCNGHTQNGVPVCLWNGGGDKVYANNVSTTPPSGFTPPTPSWNYWYQEARPGPMHPCGTTTGAPPTFDVDTTPLNDNVPGVFDLTPSTLDYSCVNRDGAGNLVGQIAWNHTTKTLTVYGAMFIDGNVTVSSALANYNGQATLYLGGTFTMSNGAKLCGGISGSTCDFSAWDPNEEMLIVVANGNDGSGNGIALNQSSYFQGGFQATNNITVGQSAIFEGPMMGGSLILGNSVQARPFPVINTVPLGTPGNPNVYANAQNPTDYSG
jgi:hypothetical protein